MSHRVVCCGMLVILLSGMATSAFSASNRAGLSSGFGKKRVRAVAVQRHRTRAASSILGALDLRRLGPLPSPGQVSAASAILVDGTTGERCPPGRRLFLAAGVKVLLQLRGRLAHGLQQFLNPGLDVIQGL